MKIKSAQLFQDRIMEAELVEGPDFMGYGTIQYLQAGVIRVMPDGSNVILVEATDEEKNALIKAGYKLVDETK